MALPVGFRVAAAYLMSPERTSRLAGAESPSTALPAGKPGDRADPQAQETALLRLAADLQKQSRARLESIRSEDVVAACRKARSHGHVDGRGQRGFLWGELLDLARIAPSLSGGHPSIPEKSLLAWLEVQDAIEPDAALLAHLGYHSSKWEPASFDWGRVVPIECADLDELFSRGVYDLHVHAGGLRNFTTTWRALRAGNLRLDQLAAFERDPGGMSILPAALAAAARLLGPVTEATSHGFERRKLFEAIRDLCAPSTPARPFDKQPDPDRWIEIERILVGRTLLWRKLRQPMFHGPPGLSHFSAGYFRQSARRGGMQGKIQRVVRGGSREIGAILDLADTCVGSLRGIELRMSPLDWPADYTRFLDFWESQADKAGLPVNFSINPSQGPTDRPKPAVPEVGVRFAVHVQRSSPADELEVDLRAMLDRRTACYFLARREDPRVAEAFVRIDIAGPETNRSGSLYSPYFGLLLRQPERLRDIEWLRANRDRPEVAAEIERLGGTGAEEWLALPPEFLKPAPGERPLRASWHAGEDFGDVLAGLYEMATALSSGLRPNDTIGHGLALCAQPDGSDRSDRSGGFVSWRLALESYLWLYDFTNGLSDNSLRGRLLSAIMSLLSNVGLGRSNREAESCVDLVEQVRRLPICALCERADPDDPCGQLLRLIYDGELAGLPPVDRTEEMAEFQNLIEDAQGELIRRIAAAGVLIELNPSSNWRIFSPGSLADLPTVKIASHPALARRTIIGTDDPGTFGTSIELEYALLRRGLQEEGRVNPDVILEFCRSASGNLWGELTRGSPASPR